MPSYSLSRSRAAFPREDLWATWVARKGGKDRSSASNTTASRVEGVNAGRKGKFTHHTSDGLVKDSRGSSEMEGSGLVGVDQMPLVEVVVVTKLEGG